MTTTADKSYQYVDSWEYSEHQISQPTALYDPLGATDAKGCANCQFFVSPSRCTVVAGDISPTGMSRFWEAKTSYEMEPIPVYVVTKSLKEGGDPSSDDEPWILYGEGEPDAVFTAGDKERRNKLPRTAFAYVDSKGVGWLPINDTKCVAESAGRWDDTKYESSAAKAAARRNIIGAAKKFGVSVDGFAKELIEPSPSGLGLLKRIGNLVSGSRSEKRSATSLVPPTRGLSLFRQKDGRTRFYTVWSNNFKDREGEIFTAAAHKEFVQWATDNGEYPELWLWHTEGSKFGQVDWLDFTDDGFVHASGLVDAGKEALAETLAGQEDNGVSHGFFGLQAGNLIHAYRSYELSVLPLSNAAVWTTSFNILSESGAKEMAFTPEKRKFFEGIGISDDQIKEWEGRTENLSAALKGLGLESKAADLGVDVPPPPTQEQVVENTFRVEMMKQMQAQNDILAALAEQVKEIKDKTKDADQIVAAAMAPGNTAAVQASKAADNVVAPGTGAASPQQTAAQEFFANTILGPLVGAVQ